MSLPMPFFKALLFMGAGAIILLLHHEQNIKKMGALKSKAPLIFAVMLIATLAISGIPPFSGFFSKDAILNHLFASDHHLIFAIALITAALTSYYMFRMLLLVFISPAHKEHQLLSQDRLISITLIILSVGAVFAGLINLPIFFGGNENFSMWLNLPDMRYSISHSQELILLITNVTISAFGILLAYLHYKDSSQDPAFGRLEVWIQNKFYVDEFFHLIFVKPIHFLSEFIVNFLDKKIIDALIHEISSSYQKLSYYSDVIQNGNVRYYALYMSVGIVCIFIYLGIQG